MTDIEVTKNMIMGRLCCNCLVNDTCSGKENVITCINWYWYNITKQKSEKQLREEILESFDGGTYHKYR
jgi:hypothetical protein